jgi:hypothetical protein
MVNGAAWGPRAPSPCPNAVADSSARIHPCVHLTVVTPRRSHLASCAFLLIASPLKDLDDHVCSDGADMLRDPMTRHVPHGNDDFETNEIGGLERPVPKRPHGARRHSLSNADIHRKRRTNVVADCLGSIN